MSGQDDRDPEANKYVGLLDILNDAVISFDDGQRILYFNKAAEGIFGHAADLVVGQSMGILLPPESRPDYTRRLEEAARATLEGGLPNTLGMLWWRRQSGEYFPADGPLSTIEVDGRRIFIAVLRDLTERRRIEQSIRESESRFRLLADSAPVMIWMSGPDGLCTYFNRGWLEFTGRDMVKELGNGWADGVHPDDLEGCMETYLSALEQRQDFRIQYRLRRADGQYRWILDHGTPLKLSDDEFAGYIGSCIDITEFKTAEEETRRLRARLRAENSYLQDEIRLVYKSDEILGRSPAFLEALRKAERVAATDSAVLLLGETGTGKELFARTIHALSSRGHRPLVKVDLSVLPPALVESELFGRFELADGGTIFIDEIGELPRRLETRLLKLLRTGQVARKGSRASLNVDARVIVATNRPSGEDLQERLDLFPIHLPPLRRRVEDIPLLAELFTSRSAKRTGKRIDGVSAEVIEALSRYPWPGNVRELACVLEIAVIRAKGPALRVEDLEIEIPGGARALADGTLSAIQKTHIVRTLEESGWKIEGAAGAAERLGLNPSTLRSRMRKLGIRRPSRRAWTP